ncbi:MAG: ISNCY family transposase [Chloroflexota bacterium]|nr:ISNCY family transposase [Chloroflexota bacterium]
MLRDCYAPINLFELVPTLGMRTDRILMQLDTLLDDDTLFQAVKADLARRFPRTLIDGRPSTPVEVILRMLVVKHLYGWSYEQTEQWVSDSLVLRQFCRVYAQRVPDDTTLLRWANLIQPATLHQLLDHVVDLARRRKVTRGRKLRVDSTVVATNIHFPVDSTLLGDGVRVLTRAIQRAKQVLQPAARQARTIFRNRTRSVRQVMHRLIATSRQRGEQAAEQLKADYQQLIQLTEQVIDQATQVRQQLREHGTSHATRLATTLEQFLPRVGQVIDQTRRRVLAGESVPATEKLVSIFEPETAIIRKGKLGHAVEFGRVVWLGEVEGGIVSQYQVLSGNPFDAEQLVPSLEHHAEQFEHVPRLVAGDRKVWSRTVEQDAQHLGVRQVVLPQFGPRSQARRAYEAQRWFMRGRRWRTGIEGRISVLKRRHKLDRCRYHGSDGMERWVGWGVIAHNLRQIALAAA